VAQPVGARGPCVGLLEIASLATGTLVTDAVLKQATVRLLVAEPVTPGKWVLLFGGAVDEVTAGLRRGVEVAGDDLADRLFLADVEPSLLALVLGRRVDPEGLELDAVGLLETLSVASLIRAADAASKSASLTLLALRLAKGIGGKGLISFTGEVSDVEAALDAAGTPAVHGGLLDRRVVIPRPHPGLLDVLLADHER